MLPVLKMPLLVSATLYTPGLPRDGTFSRHYATTKCTLAESEASRPDHPRPQAEAQTSAASLPCFEVLPDDLSTLNLARMQGFECYDMGN